ncbi:SCO7613 C-terminal domain-containing membrane protein [Catellatospora sp. IY07-71]|uniref:SCO7613 C-terminal domain-containing membrane protein n=1 Tax=Catellatospora sp. IY07-71 TaxID=2728827 RepID=UPI001BB2FCA7|nr:hypothetical protein [Catellatospora sp. IY07-71]
MEPASTYPCPVCGQTATLAGPCPGCGRAPDANAAAVLAHDARIAALVPQVEQARSAYESLSAQLAQVRRDRELHATAVRTAVARERAHQSTLLTLPPTTATRPPAAGTALPPHAGRGPESSPRTVQNLLFVLGGLLLGIAAIVFTAVAWAAFDVTGRALILGVLTLGMLAVPPLVRRRALTGTAETFAALGLLLVVLDGYAVWYVNLGGVADTWDPAFYAGAVAAFTALLGYGYARAVGTAATRFGALLTAQPVLPLLFVESSIDIAGWSAVFLAVALGDLLLYRALHTPATAPASGALSATAPAADAAAAPSSAAVDGTGIAAAGVNAEPGTAAAAGTGDLTTGAAGGPARAGDEPRTTAPTPPAGRAALRVLAMLGYCGALVVGAVVALFAWLLGTDVDTAATGGLVLLAAAGVLAAGLWQVTGSATGLSRAVAGALLTLALAAAVARPALVLWPDYQLLVVASAAALVAALAVGLRRRLPERLSTVADGVRVGALVALCVPAPLVAGWALLIGWRSVVDATPWWDAVHVPFDGSYSWQPLVALVLTAGAAWALTRLPVRAWVTAATLVLLALALPDNPALSSWAPLVIDLVVAAGALAIALLLRRNGALWGGAAALLAAHALLVGARSPVHSAVALSAVVLLGLAAAAVARTRTGAPFLVGGSAGAVALALLPPAVHSVVAAAGVDDLWARRAMLAAAVLTPLWVYLSPARLRDFAVVGGLVGALWALPAAWGQDAQSVYAALCTLALALVGVQARWARAELPAQGVLALTLLMCGEALHRVFIAPLSWLTRIWAGDPVGTGLAAYPVDPLPWAPAIALFLLVPAVAFWFWRPGRGPSAEREAPAEGRIPSSLRPALAAAGLTTGVAVLVALAAAGAPWPTVSAVQLVLGTALLVLVALRPAGVLTLPGGLYGLLLTGVGLAGLLAEKWSTIAGLALVTVALSAVAVGARARAARTAGWLSGAAVKVLLAIAVGEAAELRTEFTAYLVLGVAALVLGLAYAPFVREQRAAAEAAAHSAALVALTLCHGQGRPSALVLALWGVAAGLTVLRAPAGERLVRAAAAAVLEALAWWVILFAEGVGLLEAYTLPVALLAVGVGWYAARRRPELSSWLFAGPALAAALLPSLAGALTDEGGTPLRRLLLGAGALAVTVFGAVRRLQAPVLLGGAVLLVLALHELLLVSRLLPTWVPIAVGGAVLLALAITYERSRRDVARLRAAVGRMR